MLALLIAGQLWPKNDLAMIITGILVLALSGLGLKAMDGRLGKKRAWQARLVSVDPRTDLEQPAQAPLTE